MTSDMPQAVMQWLDTLAIEYGDSFTVHLKRDGSGRIKHEQGTDTFNNPEAATGPYTVLRYRITLGNQWNIRNKVVTVTCNSRQEGIVQAEEANKGWTFVRAEKLKEVEQ